MEGVLTGVGGRRKKDLWCEEFSVGCVKQREVVAEGLAGLHTVLSNIKVSILFFFFCCFCSFLLACLLFLSLSRFQIISINGPLWVDPKLDQSVVVSPYRDCWLVSFPPHLNSTVVVSFRQRCLKSC
jgi:hypothetical protein